MLRVAALESRYGRIPALKGIDLRVEAGELVALVGANGAGKTTLLRALSGVQPVAAGRIEFCGENVTAAAPEARVRLGIVQVPEGRQVFGPLSVEDNLRLGAYRRGRAETAESLERVYALFPDLVERRAQAAGNLSGGQQQMLAMGRALMARPRLLLLDEPSLGLSPLIVAEMFNAIRRINGEGTAVLLVEQNVSMALRVAQRVYVLEEGRMVAEGAPDELMQRDEIRRAYLGV